MEKDYGPEIDELKQQVNDLKQLFTEFARARQDDKRRTPPKMNKVHSMRNMHPDPKIGQLMDRLCQVTDEKDLTGAVTYLGVFTSGGRQSNWIRNEVSTDDLLSLIENKSASTVLQCIGNSDRLSLLLTLLRTPMTVASLVEKCHFNSTGQVYHHLKPLIAADIVFEIDQAERGVYAVKPHRVQGIIMLLTGISDLLDPKYSQGDWKISENDG